MVRYNIDYYESQGIDETLSTHLADPFPRWRLVRVIERKHTETFIIECYDDEEFYSITRSYDEDGEAHWEVTA